MNHILRLASLVLPLGLIAALPARADDEIPNNNFRIGSYTVFFHTHADDLQGPYVPPGANIKAENIETLYLGYVRRVSTHFEVELALGYPPLTKTKGSGPATLGSVPYDGQVISTARWISPTLLFHYKFLDDSYKLRPYIGVGVNYTSFYARQSTPEGDAASGGPTRLSLTSSVGPAGTVGLAYNLGHNFGAYASYSISQVKTHLTADTAGIERTTHISFGPQALIVSVGYSFGR